MEDLFVRASDQPWEQVSGGPQGMQRKVLRKAADGTPKVALLKLEPGFEMDAHSHSHAENHYVLEGMYETEGTECPSGSYRMVPKHNEHGPFRSQAGALLLVVWED
jgi:anti-sigma factor ChrR (cupin superfamily)